MSGEGKGGLLNILLLFLKAYYSHLNCLDNHLTVVLSLSIRFRAFGENPDKKE